VRRASRLVAALSIALALAVLLGAKFCYYRRVEPEAVRSQLIAAGIVGQSPTAAAATLRQLSLPRGSTLAVGTFDPAAKQLHAAIDDAARVGWYVWYASITLGFDDANRVDRVTVALAGDVNL
jgi:hypothetical protein